MLALAEYEATHCEGCGHDLEESLSTEAEEWAVPPPLRCAVCTRISQEQYERAEENAKRPGGGHLHALRYRVVRKRRRG